MKIILPLFLETDDHVLCYLHFEDQIFVSIITLIYSVSVVLIKRVLAPPPHQSYTPTAQIVFSQNNFVLNLKLKSSLLDLIDLWKRECK